MLNKVSFLNSGAFVYWLPVITWAALIFCASSIPGTRIPYLFSFQDKIVHTIVYLILGILILWAFKKTNSRLSHRRRYLLTFLGVLFYGITDEFHQAFVPLRDPSLIDVCFDAFGGWLAILTFTFFDRSNLRKQ